MKRDLKLNMSHLDAISRKVQSYIDAMEAVGLAARKFEQTIKDQDSDAYNKLSEQWETNVWENETAMMRVDRNDIWWNYKQIEGEATSFDWIVQDTHRQPTSDCLFPIHLAATKKMKRKNLHSNRKKMR